MILSRWRIVSGSPLEDRSNPNLVLVGGSPQIFLSFVGKRLISSSKYRNGSEKSGRASGRPLRFWDTNGKVQEFLGKNGQSFRPGREAGCFRGHVPDLVREKLGRASGGP